MAVDPDDVDDVAATVASIYREAETDLTRRISDRLAKGSDSPEWADRKLAAVKDLRKSADSILGAMQSDASRAIVDAAHTAYRAGWSSALDTLPKEWFGESGIPEKARQAADEVPGYGAVEALAEAVNSDVGDRTRNLTRDVLDDYRDVVNAATGRTLTGTSTQREAAQAAWRKLTDRGILGFQDKSGRRWQLSSYAEMATRTVAQRAAITAQTDRLHAADVDLVYVSDHGQECDLCRPYEGQVLRIDDGPTGDIEVEHELNDGETVTVNVYDTLDNARADGFLHPNCRHSVSAYLPGVTEPPEQPTGDPEGSQARDRQRAIERNIRKWKTRKSSALSDEAGEAAGQKVAAWQKELRGHLDANPQLKRLRYREQPGAGFTPPRSKRDDSAGAIGVPANIDVEGNRTRARRAPREGTGDDAEGSESTDERQTNLLDDAKAREGESAEGDTAAERTRAPDFTAMSDDELETAVVDYADDDETLDAIMAEMDRRAEEPAAPGKHETFGDLTVDDDDDPETAAKWSRVEHRAAAGEDWHTAWSDEFDVDEDKLMREEAIRRLRELGYKGRGLDELARASFKDKLAEDVHAAEDATNGFLFNSQGQRLQEQGKMNVHDLWQQNESYARKWASEELLEWWDTHGRVSFEQHKNELLTGGTGGGSGRTGGDSWLQ